MLAYFVAFVAFVVVIVLVIAVVIAIIIVCWQKIVTFPRSLIELRVVVEILSFSLCRALPLPRSAHP